MKRILSIAASLLYLTSCYDPSVQESKSTASSKSKIDTTSKNMIKVSGSTTMQPIMQSVANYFSNSNKNAKILVEGIGSNEGLNALWHDSTDIAMSSHEMNDSIVALYRKKKIEYAEFLLAGDALVFIVNVNNNVKKLTNEQVKGIFSGEITNWKQVGGHDGAIQTYSRDLKSGTFNFFKETILGDEKLPNSVKYLKDNQEIISSVTNDKNAIGYTSFTNLDYSVNPLDISFDEGATYVSPRLETVNNLKYKYFRGLFLYYKPESYNKIKPFLDSAKSDSVQKIIKASGYIPLSHKFIINH